MPPALAPDPQRPEPPVLETTRGYEVSAGTADMPSMKKYSLKTIVLAALLLAGALLVNAQPTASPASLTFTYQVNTSTYPTGKLTATLPKSLGSGYTLTASASSSPTGWLTVTPESGASPLAITVTVNTTSLNPGSYSGTITLGTSPASTTATVPVSLSISNPPPALVVSPPTPLPTYFTPGPSAALTFNYTTGTSSTDFPFEEIDVASNGGTIPFTVAAVAAGKSAAWLRVNGPGGEVPKIQTGGVVNLGSYVPIYVSIDFTTLSTLDVGSYAGTVTFTNSTTGATVVVNVNLNISAGAPTVGTIFPTSVVAGPAAGRVSPVVTIYGDNFFTTSEVTLTPDGGVPYPNLKKSLLSRKVLQATIDPSYLTAPGTFTLKVANGKTLANPTPQEASITFTVADPTVPLISSIMNAASYLRTATQTGSAANPVPASGSGSTSASPREIIAIFGQNLGPAGVTQIPATTGNFPNSYPLSATAGPAPNTTSYTVVFSFGVDPTCAGAGCVPVAPVAAPLLMTSSNQINAIVPLPPPAVTVPVTGLPSWVQVTETATVTGIVIVTDWFPITVLPEDPGVFTFGGLGQGQGAVLNYDATTGYSINSTKNPAPKGSTISLYATGMGDLMAGVVVTVTDSSSTAQTASMTFPLVVNPSQTSITPPSVAMSPLQNGVQNSLYVPFTLLGTAGTPPYIWAVTGLPPGMSMNAAGLLTGTPSVAGPYNPMFTLTDSSVPKQTASAPLSLTIGAELITISPIVVPDGVQNLAYMPTTLVAAGGKTPYTWSLASPLPPGLSLSATGQLGGTPTTPGPYNFFVQVTDSASPPVTLTPNYQMTVNPGIAITTPTLPDGVVGVSYTATLAHQGGTAPFLWSFTGGLPAGLALDTAKGVVSGKPSAPGLSFVQFTVSDSAGMSAIYLYPFNIAPAIQITTVALPSPLHQYEALPSLAIQATGGTPPYKWSALGLPPGLVLGNTGVLSGVPLTQVSLPLIDGAVSLGAVYLNDNTYRVDIDGQPAVTSYAGASQGSVAGLVQINAVVPPTARTGASIPLTVSIGTSTGARRSQLGVTLAVK